MGESHALQASCGDGTILVSEDSGDGIEDREKGFWRQDLVEIRNAFSILTEAGLDIDPYRRGFSVRTGNYSSPDGIAWWTYGVSFPCWL